MEQKVILLACAAGMSTSLLVTKMQEVSKKDKIFCDSCIESRSKSK